MSWPRGSRLSRTGRSLAEHDAVEFIHGFDLDQLPATTARRLRLLILDLFAVANAGRPAPATLIAADTAGDLFAGTTATAWLDDRPLSPAGAAFANGVLANVLDLDDGHSLTKGHPGAAVIPAAAAVAEHARSSGREFLGAVAVGYEVAVRAAIAQHDRSPEYHGTGSWGAVGAAAATARLLGLSADQTAVALGIAEYHAPLSLIMRSVAAPAMTKDGIGWGAHVGVTSAFLAQRGFTATAGRFGATSITDWGTRWHLDELYLKPYPCCRWAQPAVAAAAAARATVAPDLIRRVRVTTFEAAAALAAAPPTDTEQAQYSLRWPVACLLARGRFTVADVLGGYDDPATRRILDAIDVTVSPVMTAAFPARRLASLRIELTDGSVTEVGPFEAHGEGDDPHWDELALSKARTLLSPEPNWPRAVRRLGVHTLLDELLSADG